MWCRSIKVVNIARRDVQATLPRSCLAKSWIWCRGNGANSFSLRKSYTHIPKSSDTRHMWFRWSNQCRRCIHLLADDKWALKVNCMRFFYYFRFKGSRSLSFWRTRTSIRLASRYLGIARMILIATFWLFCVSMASTTLPKVPWPSKRTVRSKASKPSMSDEVKKKYWQRRKIKSSGTII